ncbi:MAG: hypothetical protein HKN64_06335 [Woeseiaceae bacterium]|nr:hypothetical protein [Woeseiaceae bacterium]
MILLTTVNTAGGVELLYKEPLEQMRMAYAASPGEQSSLSKAARELRFEAFGKRFDIELEVNRSLLDAVQRAHLDERYEIYRGTIAGLPGSWVRLVFADGVPRGMLWDGEELMAIDVSREDGAVAADAFIYRLRDLRIPPGTLACSDIGNPRSAAELASAVVAEVGEATTQSGEATSQIDIAVIADYEFTSANGPGTNVALTTRMNNVDGIFSMQLGVQLNVNRIDTYPENNDPFSDETVAGDLLDELTDYRFATPEQYANGLTHLFTGRDLDENTVGVAYTGALCNRRFGAGLTEGSANITLDSLIAAHEFGHNFGAPHDGTDEPPCEDVPQTFLMAPQLNGSSEFSSCSIAEIQDDINRASCITAMASTDVAVAAVGQSTALLGDAATIAFEANNVGTNSASGVTMDVTIPAGVVLSSVTATAGTCTSGAGTVSCTLGTIAAGSGATVNIDITPSDAGSFDFVANLDASSDANSGNNQATQRLVVSPAVDLVATAAAAATLALNASTTLNANLENRSAIAATGVTLTVTPQAGLTLNSAGWSAGGCSITNNIATCEASSLAAQSNTGLQLGVTGSTAGNRSYTIAASSAEAERQPSNNEVSGQVTVSSPPGTDSSGGGGGGSLGWLSLLCLALASGRARRRGKA